MSKDDRAARSDSNEFLQEATADAINGIKPPAYAKLRVCDLPYWKDITDARFDWTEIDLAHAVNLARTMADLAENQKQMDTEGYIIFKGKDKNGVTNPRHAVIKDLTSRAISLSSKLQVHAAATIGEIENNRLKNAAKNKAVQEHGEKAPDPDAAPNLSDEDLLIGRPVQH